jgi:hypothetical protein
MMITEIEVAKFVIDAYETCVASNPTNDDDEEDVGFDYEDALQALGCPLGIIPLLANAMGRNERQTVARARAVLAAAA